MKLQEIDISALDKVSNPYDLRKDLHVYVDYMYSREVKRTTRDNRLPKTEAKRMAKLLSDPGAVQEIEARGGCQLLDFLDWFALRLGFVSYETEGIYLGYTSSAPSFPDNFVEIKRQEYEKLLHLSQQKQEQYLLDTLINSYSACSNEFFVSGIMGCLDSFDRLGCNTGVLTGLNFAQSRQMLLKLLAECQSDVWYSVSSLIQILKQEYTYFLIPRNPKITAWRRTKPDRYENFKEFKDKQKERIQIHSQDPDGFERVEGRYVERFLESIPLVMGYLELAYGQPKDPELRPYLNKLQGFKVNKFFLSFMQSLLPEPCVTVEPNFEIQVESNTYPVKIINKLSPLVDCKRTGTVTTLKLNRKKVAHAVAEDDSMDVPGLLKRLSNSDIPENVRIELEEWMGQADAFTVFMGYGLLESSRSLSGYSEYYIENIASGIDLVQYPEELFARLEEEEAIPIFMPHSHQSLRPMPPKTKTCFPKMGQEKDKAKKKKVTLERSTTLTIKCPNKEIYEAFYQSLIRTQCAFEPDQKLLSLRYSRSEQKEVESALDQLKTKYQIQITDTDS